MIVVIKICRPIRDPARHQVLCHAELVAFGVLHEPPEPGGPLADLSGRGSPPSPSNRATSSSRPPASLWTSMCRRFLPGLPSGAHPDSAASRSAALPWLFPPLAAAA